MKHIISKNIGIEEFKNRFSEIRETFLDSLTAASDGYKNVRYLACDEDGAPINWVWDDETFSHNKEEGSLEEAIKFANNMIDSGMCFSYMGCLAGSGELEVWLTTFESPIEKPTWPSNKAPLFELTHGGVTQEQKRGNQMLNHRILNPDPAI